MSDGILIQTMQGIFARLDQIDDIKAEIKEEYAQAKAAGYDKTALGAAIREIRGRDKAQTPAAEERAAIVDLYVSTFDNAPRTYVHVPAREAAENSRTATPESLPAAQSEAAAGSRPEQGADERASGDGVVIAAQSAQFVTPSGEGEGASPSVEPSPAAERPSFARKEYVLRPHCQRPEMCSSYGSKHCGPCERAAKAAEDDDSADVPAFVRKSHDHIAMGEQA
jgi:uncharacterized protein (UPF0335 family)